jgi:hypothetical protein
MKHKSTAQKREVYWVSVEERLPEDWVSVDTWNLKKNIRAYRADGEWFDAAHDWMLDNTVTHWMELPDGPK